MTVREAIEVLTSEHCGYTLADIDEAADMAVEALKKQEGKKAMGYTRAIYGGGKAFHYRCEACRRDLSRCDNFCRNCGQAIDWSDVK